MTSMLIVTFARDGRTWYGRRLYRIRIEREDGGSVDTSGLIARDGKLALMEILNREVAEGRPFRIVDNR